MDFSQPINMIFDENSVFISYFNLKTTIYEIWAIESFHSAIEVSFVKMYKIIIIIIIIKRLTDYYINRKEETHVNYFESEPNLVVL